MKVKLALCAAVAALLGGCFTIPMTANEFRDAISQKYPANMETYEVSRPVAEVGRSFQKKAAECLNYQLTSTEKPYIGFGSSTKVYAIAKPTVLVSPAKAELHFQVKSIGNIAKEPPEGNYFLVADATPVSNGKTRVRVYRSGAVALKEAVHNWASGNERGCPDPMRTFEQ
jgi:hypothetical protein